jgi:large subunit ribosomal protein L9
MDVILLERIEKLGQMGDVVRVKPGFARNYLLPQKKALRATEQNKKVFESQRAQLEAENLENRKQAEDIGQRLDGLKVVIVRQASDNDQLYGSVTVRNIALAVTEAGFTVDSKQVRMARPIKTVGMHPVTVRLHPEVSVTITANVARSEEEAELQAQGLSVSRYDDDEEDEVLAEAEAAFDQPEDGEGEAAAEGDAEEAERAE